MADEPDDLKAATTEFFEIFGAAVFAAAQLQYRLAGLYAVTFESRSEGSLPRVHEKTYEALGGTFGNAVSLARQFCKLDGDLLSRLELATKARNYIVHYLFLETRSLQGSATGLRTLAEPLRQAIAFFQRVEASVEQRTRQVYIDGGMRPEVYDAHGTSWDALPDEVIAPQVPVPEQAELIVNAWLEGTEAGLWLVFESRTGRFWQLVDNGLGYAIGASAIRSKPEAAIQRLLPAKLRSRPKGADYRGSFDYDILIEPTDRSCPMAVLRVHKAGGRFAYEIVQAAPKGSRSR